MSNFLQIGGVTLAFIVFILEIFSLTLAVRERRERRKYIDATERLISQAHEEQVARSEHLASLERVARIYSRTEYERLIQERIDAAQKIVLCYWFSLHREDAGESYVRLNNSLRAAARDRKVVVRVITARERERISAAHELTGFGIHVRFHRTLLAHDLRFVVTDHKWVILGIPPDRSYATTVASHEGVEFTGEKLAAILLGYFDQQWSHADEFDKYAGYVVCNYLDDQANTVDLICAELSLPQNEVTRLSKIERNSGASDGNEATR